MKLAGLVGFKLVYEWINQRRQYKFFGQRTALLTLGNGLTCSMMNNARTASAVQAGATPPGSGDYLGYDGAGRMITKRYLPASGTNVAVVGYTTAYDPSSNKLFEQQLHGDGSRSSLYDSYDSMDRLLDYQRGVLNSTGTAITTHISLPRK